MKICDSVYLVGSGAVGISNEFDCNVYLIDGGRELALVDAGVGVDTWRVIENVKTEGLDPEKISHVLLTHAHPDHAGGTAKLVSLLGCNAVSSREEAEIVKSGSEEELGLQIARASGGYFPDYRFEPATVCAVESGAVIDVGYLRIRAVVVPGHSVASVCYITDVMGRKCLFSGDTVFINGLVSLLNCPGCSIEKYRRSIGKLSGLGIDALLPGHLLFTIAGGQAHIDRAIKRFGELQVPTYIGLID